MQYPCMRLSAGRQGKGENYTTITYVYGCQPDNVLSLAGQWFDMWYVGLLWKYKKSHSSNYITNYLPYRKNAIMEFV